MFKVFAFVVLVFSQPALAASDEIYRCGNNTYQNLPCAYTKSKPVSDMQVPEKSIKEPKKASTTNKSKPLATTPVTATPKVEPITAPVKPVPPVVTKKPAVTPTPAPKPEAKPIMATPAKKAPIAEPIKAPEPPPAAIPEQASPPVATPEPAPEPAKAEEPPPKPQADPGVCDSLRSGLENIANQKKSGAGDAADLSRQQKELESVMKESGC